MHGSTWVLNLLTVTKATDKKWDWFVIYIVPNGSNDKIISLVLLQGLGYIILLTLMVVDLVLQWLNL